jgi:hypothetical protein
MLIWLLRARIKRVPRHLSHDGIGEIWDSRDALGQLAPIYIATVKRQLRCDAFDGLFVDQ